MSQPYPKRGVLKIKLEAKKKNQELRRYNSSLNLISKFLRRKLKKTT
jgi:hypothetical protein